MSLKCEKLIFIFKITLFIVINIIIDFASIIKMYIQFNTIKYGPLLINCNYNHVMILFEKLFMIITMFYKL